MSQLLLRKVKDWMESEYGPLMDQFEAGHLGYFETNEWTWEEVLQHLQSGGDPAEVWTAFGDPDGAVTVYAEILQGLT